MTIKVYFKHDSIIINDVNEDFLVVLKPPKVYLDRHSLVNRDKLAYYFNHLYSIGCCIDDDVDADDDDDYADADDAFMIFYIKCSRYFIFKLLFVVFHTASSTRGSLINDFKS